MAGISLQIVAPHPDAPAVLAYRFSPVTDGGGVVRADEMTDEMARPDSDLTIIDHAPGHQRETAEVVCVARPEAEDKARERRHRNTRVELGCWRWVVLIVVVFIMIQSMAILYVMQGGLIWAIR